MLDQDRCRAIVKAAAAEAKSSSVRAWLDDDPRGTWETIAAQLIAEAAEKHPDVAAENVDAAAAVHILIMAYDATIRMLQQEGGPT